MKRGREFAMEINNLAALFRELSERLSYIIRHSALHINRTRFYPPLKF